jgi:hypothetical protein
MSHALVVMQAAAARRALGQSSKAHVRRGVQHDRQHGGVRIGQQCIDASMPTNGR